MSTFFCAIYDAGEGGLVTPDERRSALKNSTRKFKPVCEVQSGDVASFSHESADGETLFASRSYTTVW